MTQRALSVLSAAWLGIAGVACSGSTTSKGLAAASTVDTSQPADAAAMADGAADAASDDAAVPLDAPPPTDALPDATTAGGVSCGTDQVAFAQVNVGEVTLHVACQGDGPTIVWLHGFPELWAGWKRVFDAFAPGFRLVAPDQRGYNLSDKPSNQADYHIDHLVADIAGLLGSLGTKVVLVGHDWGGPVAWVVAHRHPELLNGLVIINGPHPDVFLRELAENPDQQQARAGLDQLVAEGSEDVLAASDFSFLGTIVFDDTFTDAEKAVYKAAWGQPGALKAMVSWYRANLFQSGGLPTNVTVSVPTLVIWAMADTALLPGNLVGLDGYVTDLTVAKVDGASHWVAHERPELIAEKVGAFTTQVSGGK